MFERFDQEAKEVVRRAFDRATTLGHAHVGTEHLLLALLDVDAPRSSHQLVSAGVTEDAVYAAIARLRTPRPQPFDRSDVEALQSIGIDLDLVLERVQANLGPVDEVQPHRRFRLRRARGRVQSWRGPTFAPQAKQVLVLALREALRLEHRTIGAEHVLLGLIRAGEGLGSKIIVESGVDLADLKRRVESALAKAA